MRVLVCGGRDYKDRDHVWQTLARLNRERGPITCIIHGAASGADSEAAFWGRAQGIEVIAFRPDWDAYGNAAGPIRNEEMVVEGVPDLCLAFPGGRGTQDCVSRAERNKVEVILVPARKRVAA